MKQVFVDMDSTRVAFARNLLEAEGIACFIQNEHTRTLGPSIAGYSYTHLLDPALCILDDSQWDRAMEIIRTHFQSGAEDPALETEAHEWVCTACGESSPGGFDLCWNCGHERVVSGA